jgi:hypothetical protein
MQYYLGRQIGVTGTRLAAVDAKSPHLIAKHVTALEGTVR